MPDKLYRTLCLLGVHMHQLEPANALEAILLRDPATFGYVVTPNVDHIVRINEDARLTRIYDDAFLCLCDSRVLRVLSRLFGLGCTTVVTGSGLVRALFDSGRLRNRTVCIVGSTHECLATLKNRYDLKCCVHVRPRMGFYEREAEVKECIAQILTARADFVFLAVGSPRQELLAHRLAATAEARGTCLCIGASIDFLGGTKRYAPSWMQACCLEWLFRLATEPRRLIKRYVTDMRVFWLILRYRMHRATEEKV